MANIFIVDDNPDIVYAMEYWLKRKHHAVEVFYNSEGLLNRIEEVSPGLIFLDVNLAGEDGRDVCKQLKDASPQIHVVLFSANPYALMDYKACRADDAFSKPFDLSVLDEKIRRFAS